MVAICLILAGATKAAFGQAVTTGDPGLTPQVLISKVVERDPRLNSFEAHVDIRMHTGIPFLNPTLEGTTYFKRPGNYEVVFTKVPSYAHGIEKLYSDAGDPVNWEQRFVMSGWLPGSSSTRGIAPWCSVWYSGCAG